MMRGSFRFSRTAIFLAVLAVAGSSTYGQGREPSGSLSGVVVDTVGRFMPNVDVSVKNNTTGAVAQMVTTTQGRFTMPELDAGNYTVTCSLQDFKPVVLSDVRVMAATPTTIRATLVDTQARSGQTPPPPAPPQPPQASQPPAPPKPAQPAKPPTAPEVAPPPSEARSSNINVRIEVTITDQTGSGAPTKKMVSLTVSDGGRGQVRSGVTVPIPSTTYTPTAGKEGDLKPLTSYSYRDMGLSLDVTNALIRGNFVRLRLAVEYNPVDEKMASIEGPTASLLAQGPASFARFSQTLDLVLENGKPLVVASSSDPVPSRNRTASLEVKATILK